MAEKQKGLSALPIIIIILVVAAFVLAGYFAYKQYYLSKIEATPTPAATFSPTSTPTPTPDITLSWPVYSDNNLGFQMKYPPNLQVSQKKYPGSQLTFIPVSETYTPGQNIPSIIIYASKISPPIADQQQMQNFLINKVTYNPSGKNPQSFGEFQNRAIGNNNFYYVKTGLFEGELHLAYFLTNASGIFAFNLVSSGVDWTNPNFDSENNQGHIYLKQMLSTLNFTSIITPIP